MGYYLIDFENVHDIGLNGVAGLSANDEICIFYSDKSEHMSFDTHVNIMKTPATVKYIKLRKSARNYLDFQLVTHLGYLIGSNAPGPYYIISKDTGYESAIDYWRDHGVNIIRQPSISYTSRQGRFPGQQSGQVTPAAIVTVQESHHVVSENSPVTLALIPENSGFIKKPAEPEPEAEKALPVQTADAVLESKDPEAVPPEFTQAEPPAAEAEMSSSEKPEQKNSSSKSGNRRKKNRGKQTVTVTDTDTPVPVRNESAAERTPEPPAQESILPAVLPETESVQDSGSDENPSESNDTPAESSAENAAALQSPLTAEEPASDEKSSPEPQSADSAEVSVSEESSAADIPSAEPFSPVPQEKPSVVDAISDTGNPADENSPVQTGTDTRSRKNQRKRKNDSSASKTASSAENTNNAREASHPLEFSPEQAEARSDSLPESYRSKVRTALRGKEIPSAHYAAIYKAIVHSYDKLALNNLMVKTFGSSKGGIVYNQIKDIFTDFHQQ